VSQHPIEPADAVARLATINFARSAMDDVLATVVTLARDAVTPAVEVSITLMSEGRGSTAAYTGSLAVALDEQQYGRGYGPCLDACDSGEVLSMADAAAEDRWPSFTARAVELGVLSSLSVPLPVQDAVTGALNLYAATPRAFDDAAVHAATTFAEHAAVAVANARSYESAATLIERMRRAARTRSVIDQAKGILIGRHGMSAEAALDVLILVARQSDRRLSDAAAVVLAAAQPGTIPPADADVVAMIDAVRRHGGPAGD
jgi:transcriptional regulator with GAF, ATPase, and Fis domain